MKKNAEKVDKGFELFYEKLSWRRKFIRTLWLLPLAVLSLAYAWARAGEHRLFLYIFTLLLPVIWIWQAVYTYRRWKAEEQN